MNICIGISLQWTELSKPQPANLLIFHLQNVTISELSGEWKRKNEAPMTHQTILQTKIFEFRPTSLRALLSRFNLQKNV